MQCVYGKTVLTAELRDGLPAELLAGFAPCLGWKRRTLTIGRFEAGLAPEVAGRRREPAVELDAVPEYLAWLFAAPSQAVPATRDTAAVLGWVREELADWHPALRRIVGEAEVSSVVRTAIRSARPVAAWPTSRVTLLGDAIHAMTPAGGIGANTALRDAALLARSLAGVMVKGDVIATIAGYEGEMREYGFAAAERSLRSAAPLYQIDVEAMTSRRASSEEER